MKAVVYHEYGTPDVLSLQEVSRPTPADDEALVRVLAVSLNRSDWEGLTGSPFYARIGGLRRPRRSILGSDIAGRVEAVGKDHTSFKPGDEVFGDIISRLGGLAEYACLRGDAVALKPASLTFEQAAALPQAAVIALQGLRDRGKVQPGHSVLVNGAGGGAGSFAIQLAKLYGAEVTGVDSAAKQGFMRSLGADHTIDYAREDFTSGEVQYDLVLDLVAQRPVSAYRKALKPGGSYYFVGGSAGVLIQVLLFGPWISRTTGRNLRLLAVRPNREDLLHIAELVAEGKLVPHIDRTYPLNEVPEALRYLGAGQARGKIVIRVAQELET